MEQKKYVFIKDYSTRDGVIKKGSDIIIFRGFLYLNGGMVLPAYAAQLMKVINDKKLFNEFLTEVEIIKNKI